MLWWLRETSIPAAHPVPGSNQWQLPVYMCVRTLTEVSGSCAKSTSKSTPSMLNDMMGT